MTNLSEDPTYLAGGLLLLAGVFLVALNITQQGKYLVRAGIMLGLAFVVVAVEWFWVTDNERIEQVVYALRQAVLHSDADGVLNQMAPNVQYLQADSSLSEDETRAMIKNTLSRAESSLFESAIWRSVWVSNRGVVRQSFGFSLEGAFIQHHLWLSLAPLSQPGRWVFRKPRLLSGR